MLPRRPLRPGAPLFLVLSFALFASVAAGASGCATLGLGPSSDEAEPAVAAASEPVDGAKRAQQSPSEDVEVALTSVDETTPITSEDVSFRSGEDTLKGTVFRPVDDEVGVRRPAVVLLHDFGPVGRDGLFRRAFGISLPVEVAVYRGLAERLASHGFVVLTYDKRTCVKTAAPWCEYPRPMVEDHRDRLAQALLGDAQAAMAYMGSRDDVDAATLHLVGHGQGADLALALEPTGRRVLLAPSPHPVDALVRHQTARSIAALERAIADDDGTTRADLWKRQLAELQARQAREEELFAAIRQGEGSGEVEAFGLSAEAWRGLIALHETAMGRLSSAQAPVLAVMGELDLELPEGSQEEIAARLSEGESRMVVVPALTHLMVDAGEGADPTVVSEAVITAVVDFLVGAR